MVFLRVLGATTLVVALLSSSAWAQLGGIDAEFAGAGARALAMGGAFLGLGDDATAAEFNPAGLQILRRPEAAWQFTHTFDRRDDFLFASSIDRVNNPSRMGLRGRESDEWTTPSFASYVHPGQKITWAVSQLTTIDFDRSLDDVSGDREFHSTTRSTNNAFGLSFATDIKPRLHLGTTLRMNRFDFYHRDNLIGPDPVELTDWSPSFNVGLLWRKSKDWSFGAVYKSSQKVEGLGGEVNTQLPETWGIGVAYHPNDKIRLLADIDYISWSDFDSISDDDFVRNDVTRFHLGGEYLLSVEDDKACLVRAGYMLEESNALFYDGPQSNLLTSGFPEEDDLHHITFGFGVAREKYQIDWAVDHVVDGATTLILSMVHYF